MYKRQALKVYLEWACTLGITFGYTQAGEQRGLCRAERLIYITTAGGPLEDRNFGYEYVRGVAGMLGITNTHCVAAQGLDIRGNDPEAILREDVYKRQPQRRSAFPASAPAPLAPEAGPQRSGQYQRQLGHPADALGLPAQAVGPLQPHSAPLLRCPVHVAGKDVQGAAQADGQLGAGERAPPGHPLLLLGRAQADKQQIGPSGGHLQQHGLDVYKRQP